MKKFEIVKTTAEISWKERNEIKEGCTMYDVQNLFCYYKIYTALYI